MSALKKLAIGVLTLAIVLVGVGFLLPRSAEVERSIVIQAPPATVFAVLNGFRNFNRWSPWADLDPEARYAYTGPVQGVGAKMSWAGSDAVGSGSQEILESEPYQRIRIRLTFSGWDDADNHASYLLSSVGESTHLTWRFEGDFGTNLLGRYFGLMMDRFIGADYAKGLARLKNYVEQLPAADFSGLDLKIIEAEPVVIAYSPVSSAANPRSIGVALGVAYGKVSGFLTAQGLRQVAPPLALYQEAQGGVVRFDAAIPVDRDDVLPGSEVRIGRTFSGTAIQATYRGPYSGLPAAHEAIAAYLDATGFRREGRVLEQYVSDPTRTPETDLVTTILYPVR
jgi:effector-binding domain-containing protein/uncharacterized protein YndB with AHSA1/START domain